jgi:small-conductance mechanosensitive channel
MSVLFKTPQPSPPTIPHMTPKALMHGLLATFVIWAVPFSLSLFFFDAQRQLLTPFWVFKSCMTAALFGITWFTLPRLFRAQPSWFAARGLVGALIALGNIALDALVILPLTGMPWTTYLLTTATFYIMIPIIAIALGGATWQKHGQKK